LLAGRPGTKPALPSIVKVDFIAVSLVLVVFVIVVLALLLVVLVRETSELPQNPCGR
jgi:hypothetical protein